MAETIIKLKKTKKILDWVIYHENGVIKEISPFLDTKIKFQYIRVTESEIAPILEGKESMYFYAIENNELVRLEEYFKTVKPYHEIYGLRYKNLEERKSKNSKIILSPKKLILYVTDNQKFVQEMYAWTKSYTNHLSFYMTLRNDPSWLLKKIYINFSDILEKLQQNQKEIIVDCECNPWDISIYTNYNVDLVLERKNEDQ